MTVNPALATLLRRLHQGDISGARETIDQNPSGAHELTASLEHHELAGYCHALLRDEAMLHFLPADSRVRLESAYERQQKRNQLLLDLLGELRERLDDAGVPFLVMKGFLQSVRYAGGIDRRFMWDQDITIRPDDLEKTLEVTESMGLHAMSGGEAGTAQLLRHLHAVERVDGKRKVDIHWVFRNRQGGRKSYDDIAQHAQTVRIGDSDYQAISDLDSLTLSILGLADDIEHNRIKLRKIWDIYLILHHIDTTADWNSWFSELETDGSLSTTVNVLSFCLLILDAAEDVPNASRALQTRQDLLFVNSKPEANSIMAREGWNPANRILISRTQPDSALRYWASWLAGLPARKWHYRKLDRQRRRKRAGK